MSHAIRLIEVLFFTPMDERMGAPGLAWGPPGGAKTHMLYEFAADYGMPCKVLSPGLHGDGAFGVVPVPFGERGRERIHFPTPKWVDVFEEKDGTPIPGLLMVDELSTAAPMLQAPMLGMIQERRVGDHDLGGHVRVIGAANNAADAAGGWELAAPVANRMVHIDWSMPTAQEWGSYMRMKRHGAVRGDKKQATKSVRDTEKRVREGWDSTYAKVAGVVTAFTDRKPDALYALPPKGNANRGRAWPSLRTWEMATHVMTTAEILGAKDLISELVIGCVGKGVAEEFLTFLIAADLPDPEQLLDGKVQFKHDAKRIDRTMATLNACATFLFPQAEGKEAAIRDKRVKAFYKLVEPLFDTAPDLVIPALKVMTNSNHTHDQETIRVWNKMHPILAAAGMVKK